MLLWYVGGLLGALGISWIASTLHSAGFAPIGLVSIAVGLALGTALSLLAAMLRIAGRWHLITGTLFLALVTALAQHAWLYVDFRRQWQEARAKSPEVAMFRPETPWSPSQYFARELTIESMALWTLDAALIAASAIGVVAVWQSKRK
jgi:hypothetical protein